MDCLLHAWRASGRRYALITGIGLCLHRRREKLQSQPGTIASHRACTGSDYASPTVCSSRTLMTDNSSRTGPVQPNLPSWIVNGSGVDTESFPVAPLPSHPNFLFVGRVLRDKGVIEYVEAARALKATCPQAAFHLVGPLDSNPSGINADIVSGWVKEGVVQYHGAVSDVKPHLAACSIFVLPSYREGTPRSVLEAMSCGRAIITTDAPGCRRRSRTGSTACWSGRVTRPIWQRQ